MVCQMSMCKKTIYCIFFTKEQDLPNDSVSMVPERKIFFPLLLMTLNSAYQRKIQAKFLLETERAKALAHTDLGRVVPYRVWFAHSQQYIPRLHFHMFCCDFDRLSHRCRCKATTHSTRCNLPRLHIKNEHASHNTHCKGQGRKSISKRGEDGFCFTCS